MKEDNFVQRLWILQGLPASGKTTWAKQYLLANPRTIRVNRDSFRKMLHGDRPWNGRDERTTWKAAQAVVETALLEGKSVIIDDTNLNQKIVAKWLALAPASVEVKIKRFEANLNLCVYQDSTRDEPVGASVIYKMAMENHLWKQDKPIVLCDIDGTVADCAHRRHFLDEKPKNWDRFFAAMESDPPRLQVVEMLEDLVAGREMGSFSELAGGRIPIFVSARPEEYRGATERWLRENIPSIREKHRDLVLFMRAGGDYRDDSIIKAEMFTKTFHNYRIDVVLDDRPRVIRGWRDLGLKVIDVGDGKEF